MNKKSFAMAAIYGASVAWANLCTSSSYPLPPQDQDYSVALGEANYNFLDQCPQDQRVTFEEFQSLISYLGLGGTNRQEDARIFEMMDLDNNSEISLEELLQYYRAKNDPIDLQGNQAPFDQQAIKDDVLELLACRASNNAEGKVCSDGYTREDLKFALPQLYNLDNIIDDYKSFEAYVSHEFKLRDTNQNGKVEQWEHDKYNNHYKLIRGFWNQSKGQGNVQETIPDNGIMTYDQWMRQDNMMVKRDYANTNIPVEALEARFHYFDRDRNGELSWWEYWSTIQEDDLQHYHFRELYYDIEQDAQGDPGYGELTESEVRDFFTALADRGDIVDSEIEARVSIMLDDYVDYANGDTVIRKWPMWGRYHWNLHVKEYGLRKIEHQQLQFDQETWFKHDKNRDLEWSYDELIQGMTDEQIQEIYDIFGKDPTIDNLTYSEVKSIYGHGSVHDLIEDEWWAFNVGNSGVDPEVRGPITVDTIDVSDPQIQDVLEVQTQVELETLFDAVDKNDDGEVVYEEVCRHYVSDTDFICSMDTLHVNITDPNFQSQDHFEGFWSAFDRDYMNSEMTEVERSNFINAVTEVNMFDDMSDADLLASFDNYDLDDNGILTKQEAQHAFHEGMTLMEVAAATLEIWDSADQNHDDTLDQTEFLAGVNLLTDSGVLPAIDSDEVISVYGDLLAHYNADQTDMTQPAATELPMDAIIQSVSQVAPSLWDALVAEFSNQ